MNNIRDTGKGILHSVKHAVIVIGNKDGNEQIGTSNNLQIRFGNPYVIRNEHMMLALEQQQVNNDIIGMVILDDCWNQMRFGNPIENYATIKILPT